MKKALRVEGFRVERFSRLGYFCDMMRLMILFLLSGVLLSCKEQPPTHNPQTTTSNQHPTTSNQQPPSDSLLLQLQQYAENGDPETLTYADELLRQTELSSFTSDILIMKVIYLGKQKKYKAAETLCDLIIKNDYTYLQAYLEKGWLLFEQNKFNEALKVFELATIVKNNFGEAYFWKGRCYQKLQQPDEAILEFQKALALDPALEEARTELKSMGAIQ
jgi:tetratricopeptide (TPR) repeat protein